MRAGEKPSTVGKSVKSFIAELLILMRLRVKFYAAPAPTKPTFLKQTKLSIRVGGNFFLLIFMIVVKEKGKSKKLLQFVTFLIIHLC
jgi:hypothetical protein